MGITQYFKDFYCPCDSREFRQGQLCWVPIPIIDSVPRILDVERNAPEDHDKVSFLLRNANKRDDFQKGDRSLPIRYLDLRSHEELLVQRAKKRPAIIISDGLDLYPDVAKILRQKGKKHLQEDSIFVLPIYGIESASRLTGYPAEMVIRIRYLLYRQFFYLPAGHGIQDGILRFDRVRTVVGRDPSAILPVPICLQEDVLALLLNLFVFCITGRPEPELVELRAMLASEYPQAT